LAVNSARKQGAEDSQEAGTFQDVHCVFRAVSKLVIGDWCEIGAVLKSNSIFNSHFQAFRVESWLANF
jgi:hypothetical protein